MSTKILITFTILLMIGCAPYPPTATIYETPKKPMQPSMVNKYDLTFSITDNSKNPLANSQIIIQQIDSGLKSSTKKDTLFTDSLGFASLEVSPTKEKMTYSQYGLLMEYNFQLLGMELPNSLFGSLNSSLKTTVYHYFFDVSVSKDGYYTFTKRKMEYGSNDQEKHIELNLQLSKPFDYFSTSFSNTGNQSLKKKILSFIDLIRIQSLIQSAELKLFSISNVLFKENSYLSIGFDHQITFNSLKLNKYDIGKRIFDEVIRKVLSPLNEYIYSPADFWGYDLSVEGKTKDFSDETANPTVVLYRFLIPAEIVKSYKNLDITGQQLLDSSVILLDNERIELRLQ